MAKYVSEQTGVTYDELIGGTAVSVLTANIAITAATNPLERGTVLTVDGTIVDGSKEAAYVLANPIEKGDTAATVYVKGQFNREKLIVAEGDTVGAHEAQLRKVSIYLTSLK